MNFIAKKIVFIFSLILLVLTASFIITGFYLSSIKKETTKENITTLKDGYLKVYETNSKHIPKIGCKIAYSQGTDDETGEVIIILRYLERFDNRWFDWNTREEVFLNEYPKVLCLIDDPFEAR